MSTQHKAGCAVPICSCCTSKTQGVAGVIVHSGVQGLHCSSLDAACNLALYVLLQRVIKVLKEQLFGLTGTWGAVFRLTGAPDAR